MRIRGTGFDPLQRKFMPALDQHQISGRSAPRQPNRPPPGGLAVRPTCITSLTDRPGLPVCQISRPSANRCGPDEIARTHAFCLRGSASCLTRSSRPYPEQKQGSTVGALPTLKCRLVVVLGCHPIRTGCGDFLFPEGRTGFQIVHQELGR